MSFESLNLNPSILKALTEAGYTQPTPIQAQAIPAAIEGRDLLASAQTGTGKTAAFMLPSLHRIATPSESRSRGPRVLVLTPTRELATQVNDAARKYGKFMRARTVSIVGGMPYPVQNKLLSQPVDILVATPGRLIDHMERGRIDFSRLEVLVLDEADRMLDMGFIDDVERIAAATPSTRQTLLFSATLDGVIGTLAERLLNNPQRIEVATAQTRHAQIEQKLHFADNLEHKHKLLHHILADIELRQAIVFTATKRDADALAEDLYAEGHKAAALHGDMNQGARNRTLTKLRHGDIRVLVATDVAARGIDVNGITHVINFDLPKVAEDYVHRIGRTGRAGNTGVAISFASHADRRHLFSIERLTGQRLQAEVIPGLEPKQRPAKPAHKKPFSGKPRTGNGESHRSGNRSANGNSTRNGNSNSTGNNGNRHWYDAKPSGAKRRGNFA
ncbi:RNA helicase [Novimethylophilus kurashikiensis]|uniref:DEAD-box ATP-dependent RNA helicase RhpA n=1 Tax=Novimethylophilus kurashikiensis TaxID=1825523 RepID=A0A2R5F220_9PROT|nr:DEAD/DEAH box helicase [Novimethylophilus kurashikiensis]GBG12697.1 RNA helicase [Novimethylophilus kurashikiensis]